MRQGLQFTNQSKAKEAAPRTEKSVPESAHARINSCSSSISFPSLSPTVSTKPQSHTNN